MVSAWIYGRPCRGSAVREPTDAMVSARAGKPHHTWREFLDFYIDYHQMVMPHRSQVVVATFAQLTQDFGKIVRRLNLRYGTDFREITHTDCFAQQCYRWLENAQRAANPDLPARILAHPDVAREPMKHEARAELQMLLRTDSKMACKMKTAEQLFYSLAQTAHDQALLA